MAADKPEIPLTHDDLMDPRPAGAAFLLRIRRALRKTWHSVLPDRLPRRFIRGNIRYETDLTDYVAKNIAMNGYLEPAQVLYFFNAARRGGANIFLDIGSNFGFYSLTATRAGCFGEIHSVEAHPVTYRRLLANIKANRLEKIIMSHNVAASDKDEELFISAFSSGLAQVSPAQSGASIPVRAAALDSILQFQGRRIAMKVDVEGYEIPALKGMEKLLSSNAILLQMEVMPERCETLHFMFANGWRCIRHFDGDFYFVNNGWIRGDSALE